MSSFLAKLSARFSAVLLAFVVLSGCVSPLPEPDPEPSETVTIHSEKPTATYSPTPSESHDHEEPTSLLEEPGYQALFRDHANAECPASALPDGYELADNGIPFSPAAPYSPKDVINPITLVNLNQRFRNTAAAREGDPAEVICWVHKTASLLILNSRTQTTQDLTVARFLLYDFPFRPNPAVDELEPGWSSGLAQGAGINAFKGTAELTGDKMYLTGAEELYESFFVPDDEGGFASRKTGHLWFEEYPSSPATHVLNGMNYATVAFVDWTRETGDERGLALISELSDSYRNLLPLFEIRTGGGYFATYDLVRGMGDAPPLRVIHKDMPGGPETSDREWREDWQDKALPVVIHGREYRFPVVNGKDWDATAGQTEELLSNPDFSGGFEHWRVIGERPTVSATGEVTFAPGGGVWQGVSQSLPASTFGNVGESGRKLSLSYSFRRDEPVVGNDGTVLWDETGSAATVGGSISAKVSVIENCPEGTRNLFVTEVPRGAEWAPHRHLVDAPDAGCSVTVQFLGSSRTGDGTVVQYANPSLRWADWVGAETIVPAYEFAVWKEPTTTVSVLSEGERDEGDVSTNADLGKLHLQAWVSGRWVTLGDFGAGYGPVTVPEELTGRNINYKYHNYHAAEIAAIHARLGDDELLVTAHRWDETALGRKVS